MLMICFCLCDVDTLMMTPKWVERWNALVKDEHGLVFLSLGLWTGGKLLLLLVTIWPDWQAGRSWLLHPSMAKLQHTNIYPCSSYIKKKTIEDSAYKIGYGSSLLRRQTKTHLKHKSRKFYHRFWGRFSSMNQMRYSCLFVKTAWQFLSLSTHL